MLADVAKPSRAEQGIAQGVQDHITVRVRDDTAAVRNPYTPQHHEVAFAKGVHVKSGSDAHHFLHAAQYRRRDHQILRRGHLDVGSRAFDQQRPSTHPFERLGLIGRRAPGIMSGFQRLAQRAQAEHLRRQRAPHSGPVHGALHRCRQTGGRQFQGIRAGRGQQATRIAIPKRAKQDGQIRCGQARSGRVVYQHPITVTRPARKTTQTVQHRLAAPGAPGHGHNLRRQAHRDLWPPRILRRQGDDDARALRIGHEGRERPLDDGPAQQFGVLLGYLGTKSASGTRRRHDEPVAQVDASP